jgi:hypothetical protein
MGKLVLGFVLILVAFFLMIARAGQTPAGAAACSTFSLAFTTFGALRGLAPW